MEYLLEKITDHLNQELILLTISSPRKAEEIKKYSVRPVFIKNVLLFQRTAYTKTQVFHKNLDQKEITEFLKEIFPKYRQVHMQTETGDLTACISKKGKAAIKVRKEQKQQTGKKAGERLFHNRTKRCLLPEGRAIPFLIDLGVMTAEGKIINKKYDKYRQINRFLEFIEDVLPHLPREKEVQILDFGCGKSYLTFAMYYYLREICHYDVRIIGLDLKKDVIRKCSALARKYGYDKLTFIEGSIEDYEGMEQVDMVVTLHACDTATDYALYKAICWNAAIILSVPCCQHELNGQIQGGECTPITNYGLLKERFCALATDGIRAKVLEEHGYETQILEFIDMEHTPKNLLIRAVRKEQFSEKRKEKAREEIQSFCRQFGFFPSLVRLTQTEGGTAE